jgi:hypothetical protein
MGRKSQTRKNRKRNKPRNNNNNNDINTHEWNFLPEAGPGCYIARRDMSPAWLIEWVDVDPQEFEGEEVPDVAIDTEEQTLSLCNIENFTQIAYITVYETKVLGAKGQELTQGSTTDNHGVTQACVTFIVICPPRVFAHLCYLHVPADQDITQLQIDSDVRAWQQHPKPSDEHPHWLGLPLSGGPFLCTQGEGGELTHFFSGNLHAVDFACPVGTPLLAVADGLVVEAKDSNSLTGVAVSNLFEWNSIILQVDDSTDEASETKEQGGPLFAEYVHIQKTSVKVGDRVTRGQVIGSSGSVGFSPEPHLHFSAFRSSDPEAPTVRVRFEAKNAGTAFLPRAGTWYDASGAVDPPPKQVRFSTASQSVCNEAL